MHCSKKKVTGSYSNGSVNTGPDVNANDTIKTTNSDRLSCASSAVSAVIGVFYGKDNYKYYRVKWESTWEEKSNLNACDDLIRSFFQKDLGLIVSIPGEMGLDQAIEVKDEPGDHPIV